MFLLHLIQNTLSHPLYIKVVNSFHKPIDFVSGSKIFVRLNNIFVVNFSF